MKKNVFSIEDLHSQCTGCLACVDSCPQKALRKKLAADGFYYSEIIPELCTSCGRCYTVCPIENRQKSKDEQHLYAAYSKASAERNGGSSGGIFSALSRYYLAQGYYVCGAAFDQALTLAHRCIKTEQELPPLLKSKYLQSDMSGVYAQIGTLLKNGESVFFCGTPCQVSALKNSIPPKYQDRLVTADIICHGVPSQKTFTDYLATLEKKHGGKIIDFSFRIKDNKYRHAHGYRYTVEKNGKQKTINGIYTDSDYYNAFKNYLFFRESCYDCKYTTLERVSDITLADFWGIEKYDFHGATDDGISMIITNSAKGEEAFHAICEVLVFKEFPVSYGVDSNYCLTHSTKKPKTRDAIICSLEENGYESTAKKYFGSGKSIKYRLYFMLPAGVRRLLKKFRRS